MGFSDIMRGLGAAAQTFGTEGLKMQQIRQETAMRKQMLDLEAGKLDETKRVNTANILYQDGKAANEKVEASYLALVRARKEVYVNSKNGVPYDVALLAEKSRLDGLLVDKRIAGEIGRDEKLQALAQSNWVKQHKLRTDTAADVAYNQNQFQLHMKQAEFRRDTEIRQATAIVNMADAKIKNNLAYLELKTKWAMGTLDATDTQRWLDIAANFIKSGGTQADLKAASEQFKALSEGASIDPAAVVERAKKATNPFTDAENRAAAINAGNDVVEPPVPDPTEGKSVDDMAVSLARDNPDTPIAEVTAGLIEQGVSEQKAGQVTAKMTALKAQSSGELDPTRQQFYMGSPTDIASRMLKEGAGISEYEGILASDASAGYITEVEKGRILHILGTKIEQNAPTFADTLQRGTQAVTSALTDNPFPATAQAIQKGEVDSADRIVASMSTQDMIEQSVTYYGDKSSIELRNALTARGGISKTKIDAVIAGFDKRKSQPIGGNR